VTDPAGAGEMGAVWPAGCNGLILPVMSESRRPADLANRIARRSAAQKSRGQAFRRETFALPR